MKVSVLASTLRAKASRYQAPLVWDKLSVWVWEADPTSPSFCTFKIRLCFVFFLFSKLLVMLQ